VFFFIHPPTVRTAGYFPGSWVHTGQIPIRFRFEPAAAAEAHRRVRLPPRSTNAFNLCSVLGMHGRRRRHPSTAREHARSKRAGTSDATPRPQNRQVLSISVPHTRELDGYGVVNRARGCYAAPRPSYMTPPKSEIHRAPALL
jgi:hypothetical protein